jgi:hypothetical protein
MSELLILPDGLFGRVAIRPDNIEPPDFKTAVNLWRRWRNESPIYLLDAWLWEREKNRLRGMWFDLTPRQREYLKDRRTDIGKPIIEMRPFRGPKYQRGMLSGMSVRRAAWEEAGAGGTLALSSLNNNAINIDFSPGGPLDAGFGLLRDGTHDRVNSGGQSQINSTTDWVTPRTSTVGDDYETKWNQISGGAMNDENYTEDTWTTLTVATGRGRYVGHSTAATSTSRTFEIDIGDDGTSTSDVNQDYLVECGDIA